MRTVASSLPRLLVLASLLLLACCRTPAPRYVSNPGRTRDLPDDPERLSALSDRLVAERPMLLPRIDRALAALEKAQAHQHPRPFEVLWRLARACFLMTERLSNKKQLATYARRGLKYARQALRLNAKRVEPQYYLALNLAKMAESSSILKLVKPMIAEGEKAAKIDETYDQAGPLRFLGKVYITAPAWPVSVGSVEKALDYLSRAMTIAPIPLNRLFLGEAFFLDEEYEEAEKHIRKALGESKDHEIDTRWRREGERFLKKIEKKAARGSSGGLGPSRSIALPLAIKLPRRRGWAW